MFFEGFWVSQKGLGRVFGGFWAGLGVSRRLFGGPVWGSVARMGGSCGVWVSLERSWGVLEGVFGKYRALLAPGGRAPPVVGEKGVALVGG